MQGNINNPHLICGHVLSLLLKPISLWHSSTGILKNLHIPMVLQPLKICIIGKIKYYQILPNITMYYDFIRAATV